MNNRFTDVFPDSPALLPVIHVLDLDQCMQSAEIAFETGVDGIFLIDHVNGSPDTLRDIYAEVRERYPNHWIGLNFLCCDDPVSAVQHCQELRADGVWIDNYPTCDLLRIQLSERFVGEGGFEGLLFAGVAFKTQRPVELDELPALALEAANKLGYYGVVTTSGPYTGVPPEREKISAMRHGMDTIECGRLAIASGMTPENVAPYVEHVDAFLVGTALENKSTGLLIPERIESMRQAIDNAR